MNRSLKRIYIEFLTGNWLDGHLVRGWVPDPDMLCIEFRGKYINGKDKISLGIK